jgi:hypothetical protein
MLARKNTVTCPVCGKKGFLTRRWVKGTYYPMYSSEACIRLEGWEHILSQYPNNILAKEAITYLRRIARGNDYRGHPKFHIAGHDSKKDREYFDRNTAYRISSNRYYYEYVGHYSPEKYKKEMEGFRKGNRKSRPNGRIWHKVPSKNDKRKGLWYSEQRQSR